MRQLIAFAVFALATSSVRMLAHAQNADPPACSPYRAKWETLAKGNDAAAMDGLIKVIPSLCSSLRMQANARRTSIAGAAAASSAPRAKREMSMCDRFGQIASLGAITEPQASTFEFIRGASAQMASNGVQLRKIILSASVVEGDTLEATRANRAAADVFEQRFREQMSARGLDPALLEFKTRMNQGAAPEYAKVIYLMQLGSSAVAPC